MVIGTPSGRFAEQTMPAVPQRTFSGATIVPPVGFVMLSAHRVIGRLVSTLSKVAPHVRA
jgi:hypothetical protein